jgi:hypothetical protein
MAARQYFAHYSPDGTSPWYWFDEVGYVYAHAGENLAVHFSDSGEMVEAWMKSPTHRANIINQQYTEIGIGTARGRYEGFDTVFVVQLFGTPAAPLPPPPVRVEAPVLPPPSATVPTLSTDTSAQSFLSGAVTSTVAVRGIAQSDQVGMVTTTASATPIALAYESTPMTDEETVGQIPVLQISDFQIGQEGVSLYSETVATSSGLPPLPIVTQASAGATDTAVISRVVTQPNTWLLALYTTIGVVILTLLVLSLALAMRAHQTRFVVRAGLLLLLMGLLVTCHIYLTAGAVIA